MDTLTVDQRSERMSRIKSKNTKPELLVRSGLFSQGYRFRIHRNDLPGKPDLVFSGRRKVVFVHGCFWHAHEGCKVANLPKSRSGFWSSKFSRNRKRDQENEVALKALGWEVMVVWECEAKDRQSMLSKVSSFLGPATTRGSRESKS